MCAEWWLRVGAGVRPGIAQAELAFRNTVCDLWAGVMIHVNRAKDVSGVVTV